jgi:uncharacterized protein (DUF1330 family)
MTHTSAPSDSQLAKLLSLPAESPVAALNLFQFNAQAQYQPDDPEFDTDAANVTGKKAFAIYGAAAEKLIIELGGRTVFSTRVDQVMIGLADVQWDLVAVVYFPTRSAFVEMLSYPEFQKISRHRKAALANHCMLHLAGDPFNPPPASC